MNTTFAANAQSPTAAEAGRAGSNAFQAGPDRASAANLAASLSEDLSCSQGGGCSGGAPADARGGGGVQSILDEISTTLDELQQLLPAPEKPSIERQAATMTRANDRLQAARDAAPPSLDRGHFAGELQDIATLTQMLEALVQAERGGARR